MPKTIFRLPLYDHFLKHDPSQEIQADDFFNKPKDFFTPLSAREVDFSIQDTTWFDTASSIAVTTIKTAVFFYLFYSFLGPSIQRLIPLQGHIVHLASRTAALVLPYLSPRSIQVFVEIARLSRAALYIGACHTAIRHIVQRAIMMGLYPAQSWIIKSIIPTLRTPHLNSLRMDQVKRLNDHNYLCREVVLEKNGNRYSGLLIGHRQTIHNGAWVLQATGNREPIEDSAVLFAETYHLNGYNTLLVNGPGVGKSTGRATPESMGEAQEVGLQFLESFAKTIIIAGRSLGGAAISQMIFHHQFKPNIHYTVIRQMTFDSVSNICSLVACQALSNTSLSLKNWLATIVRWAGCDINSVAASQQLSNLKIREIIVQKGHSTDPNTVPTPTTFQDDSVIPSTASLGYGLILHNITTNKTFVNLPHADHCSPLTITAALGQIRLSS